MFGELNLEMVERELQESNEAIENAKADIIRAIEYDGYRKDDVENVLILHAVKAERDIWTQVLNKVNDGADVLTAVAQVYHHIVAKHLETRINGSSSIAYNIAEAAEHQAAGRWAGEVGSGFITYEGKLVNGAVLETAWQAFREEAYAKAEADRQAEKAEHEAKYGVPQNAQGQKVTTQRVKAILKKAGFTPNDYVADYVYVTVSKGARGIDVTLDYYAARRNEEAAKALSGEALNAIDALEAAGLVVQEDAQAATTGTQRMTVTGWVKQ